LSAEHPAEAELAWNDSLLLGFAPMDDEHRDFVTSLQALQRAGSDTLAAQLDGFAAQARSHFASEDAWMAETDFPPRVCHMDEHAAVLKSLDEVRALVEKGQAAAVPSLIDALVQWFPGHAHHLDSALAAWMCRRRFDARPVVLRRSATRAAG
jgi:hemerythrin-like metal-binding protein